MPTIVDEKIEGNTAKTDAKGNATYTRAFRVTADSYALRAKGAVEAVVAQKGIEIGTPYEVLDPADGVTVLESDDAASCQEISAASASDDGYSWDVTVSYGPLGGEAATFPANPLEWPVEFALQSAQDRKPADEDRDGNPVLNSAGDAFDPPPEIDFSRIVFEVTRNEATFSPVLAQTWKHTVNDAVFSIAGENYAAGTVLIQDIVAGKPLFHPDAGWYWRITYKFEVKPEGWKKKILDQGMKEIVAGAKRAMKDSQGQPISSPELLDGLGVKLAAGGTPVFLEFDLYPESNFSLLALSFTGTPGF
jgi:hypothetical protein